jgi:hypothetical protein
MVRLYEVEADLEPEVDGCPGVIEPHPYRGDYYATTTGTETPSGEKLSYAVYSERYGGMIVLVSAEKEVEALIKQLGPIGGVGRFPSYRVGQNGTYYLLRTRIGVVVLLRQSSVEPYRRLEPGLARAWYLLMIDLETWLWPSHSLPGPHGTLIYKMWSPHNTERPEIEVRFDPRSGIAWCDGTPYKPDPEFEPSLNKLIQLSSDADE